MLIAVVDVGEIHGEIPGTGVQDRAELRAESLRGVMIKATLQVHAGVPGATPHNGDRLLSRVLHGSPSAPIVGVPPGSGAACRTTRRSTSSFDRHKSNERGRVSACA